MNASVQRRGVALVAAMVTLLVVTLIASTVVKSLVSAHRQLKRQQDELQAQWLAEAAAARATTQLARQSDYAGETWQTTVLAAGSEERCEAVIRIEQVPSQPERRQIVVEARYPEQERRRITVSREYTVSVKPEAGR